jgi:predicted nucleic acid-binding protein
VLVVSDTSPLRGLSALGHLTLLASLYGEVLIPPAVADELAVPVAHLPAISLQEHPFIRVRTPASTETLLELNQSLNDGEAQAIVLALEVRADALLIDEHRGRRTAARLGLRPVGLLGVLLELKQRGQVPALTPLIHELRARIAYRVDEALVQEVLRKAGEWPGP